MSRLTIEVSSQEHKRIKTMAAMNGQSIKDYVMGRLFPADQDEAVSWQELESFLMDRIEKAQTEKASSKTLMDITNEVISKRRSK
jgi:hypothetical protein